MSGNRKSDNGSIRTVSITPGHLIQEFVDANPAGTTFLLRPGVYRMQSVIPKNGDIFSGQPGATLNGSQLVSKFSQERVDEVTYWTMPGPARPGLIHGNCESTHPMCQYPEDLFIDNEPMRRVASIADVTKGTCYFDYSGAKIYFLGDPNGHVFEVSKTPVAFAGPANKVTIQALVIEKYANPAQIGAIGSQQMGSGWIIQNNEVRLNHGAGVNVGGSAQLLGNNIHDNGQLGLFGASGALIEDNEIARNNWAGFSMNWEAGGAKLGNVHNVMVRGNYVHDNAGIGIWCDGGCAGGTYENNTIQNNAMHGILHEISHAWTIRNNIIIGNGFGTKWQQTGGAGIWIDESDHVEVADNFIANNYKGIVLNMSFRTDAPRADLNHDDVHENTVVQSKGVVAALYQNVKHEEYYFLKGNSFLADRYCLGDSTASEAYWWRNGYRSAAQWVRYGEDAPGTLSCPGVFISSPKTETVISGTVTFTAFAADAVAVRSVQVYLDSRPVIARAETYTYPRTSTQAAIGVTYRWDTTKVNDGTHVLRAEAYNAARHSSSTSISLTVKNR